MQPSSKFKPKKNTTKKRTHQMPSKQEPIRRSSRRVSPIDLYQPTDELGEVNQGSGLIEKVERKSQKEVYKESFVEVEEDFEDSDVMTYLIGDDGMKIRECGVPSSDDSEKIATGVTNTGFNTNRRLQYLTFGNWNSLNDGVKTKWYSIHSDPR
jgi:hypothetical protein